MTDRIVIVGASHAAAQMCVSLLQGGWTGGIDLVSDEPHLPYHRPPLSKAYMSGEQAIEDILIRPATAYEEMEVTLHLGCRAEAIDRDEKTIALGDGRSLAYTKLVLATGARVRPLPVPGADRPNVLYLRDQADALAIRQQVAAGASRAIIIGGGYIGLEVAASLRKSGLNVTVLEAMERILQRVTIPDMSAFYRRVHGEEGVTILEGASATAIQPAGDALAVETDEGAHIADMVIVGIGVVPNSELAQGAGLTVGEVAQGESGIRVNAQAQTNDPDIYAIGDVAWHYSPIYDRHMRVESVPNATEMAKTAAAHILHVTDGKEGQAKAYGALPWFWSDQYDLKLQIAGLSAGATDHVVRGSLEEGRSVAVFHFDHDRLLAVDAVNRPREFMFAKMMIPKGVRLDKKKLADETVDLKACVVK